MTIFAMAIPYEPASRQGGRRQEYKNLIRGEATKHYRGELIEDETVGLYLRIIWFHRAPPGKKDVDNLVKPIQDGLEKVVYKSDFQVRECHATRVDIRSPFTRVDDPGAPREVVDELDRLIGSEQHVLDVEVGRLPEERRIFPGPIDRGDG